MLKSGFSMFNSQEIGPNYVSFKLVFETLQSEFNRFELHSPGSKILKISEFNLNIYLTRFPENNSILFEIIYYSYVS